MKHKIIIDLGDLGKIKAKLFPKYAPETVKNFEWLVISGFYNGLTFHRVIRDFMIQGGCPKGDGTGGASRTIKGEFASNGHLNPLKHKRGIISMARSNDKNSASSQFFIMHKDNASLDGNYAAFGKVTSGMKVVDYIAVMTPAKKGSGQVKTEYQPIIYSIELK